jgi:hypothetical protein
MSVQDQDRHSELRALLGTLKQEMPENGLPNDAFAAQLHRRLAQAGKPREPSRIAALLGFLRERPLVLGVTAGALSGVAAFVLSAAVARDGERSGRELMAAADGRATPAQSTAQVALACPEPTAPIGALASAEVFVVPVGKVAMVQLHFAVDRAVEQAEFSVLLPEGLAFFSEGRALTERAFHWQAPLAQGDNEVPIAVLGARPGKHRLAATATIAGEVVVHEIVLDVKEPT